VASHYDVVGSVLIATFVDVLGPAFTPELQAAWTAAYGHVAATMLEASEAAAAAVA
jgi:hemoglobin-like flavoprotein